jgi:hypothetical protein
MTHNFAMYSKVIIVKMTVKTPATYLLDDSNKRLIALLNRALFGWFLQNCQFKFCKMCIVKHLNFK